MRRVQDIPSGHVDQPFVEPMKAISSALLLPFVITDFECLNTLTSSSVVVGVASPRLSPFLVDPGATGHSVRLGRTTFVLCTRDHRAVSALLEERVFLASLFIPITMFSIISSKSQEHTLVQPYRIQLRLKCRALE